MRISDWSSDVCSSDLDRTGSRPGGIGVGARCQCPPASGTLLVGDAWRVEPANGAAVQVRLVYGLRGAHVDELGGTIRRAHEHRNPGQVGIDRSAERSVGKTGANTWRMQWNADQYKEK